MNEPALQLQCPHSARIAAVQATNMTVQIGGDFRPQGISTANDRKEELGHWKIDC